MLSDGLKILRKIMGEKACEHEYLKWGEPIKIDRLVKVDGQCFLQDQLVQFRHCSKCGEAQMRYVK